MTGPVVFARAMLVSFALTVAGLVWWGEWAMNEPPPPPNPNRSVLSKTVRRGDFLVVTAARVAGPYCSGWIYRQVTDSSGDLIVSETDFRPTILPPLSNMSIRRIPIPSYASLGTARYDVTIQWSCNLLQRLFPVEQTLQPLAFEIIDNPSLPRDRYGFLKGPRK